MKQFYHSSQSKLFPKQFRAWSNELQEGFDCIVWLPYGVNHSSVATGIIRNCGYLSYSAF